jgi:hypothetical protein
MGICSPFIGFMNFCSKFTKMFFILITACLVFISFDTLALALSEGDCINTSPVVLNGTITDASGIDPDSVVVMVDGSIPASVYCNRASDGCEPVRYNIYYTDGLSSYESLGNPVGRVLCPSMTV